MKNNEPRTFHDFEKLLKKSTIKTESANIIVAYGDTIGFAPWLRRALNTPAERKFYLVRLYSMLAWMRENKNLFTKGMGDGGMIVKELSQRNNAETVIEFLRDMNCFNTYMNEVITHLDFPRPDGFRVRVCLGSVIKIYLNDCKYGEKCTVRLDYVEYPTILASRMLIIAKKEYPLVCHQAVKELIGNKAEPEGISFKLLEKEPLIEFEKKISSVGIDGIDKEDLSSLWAFYVKDKSELKKSSGSMNRRKI